VPITPAGLVASGPWGPRTMRFLLSSVRGRANIIVSGGAGSGKTTMLGVLASAIADDERLITIEDAGRAAVGEATRGVARGETSQRRGSGRSHRP
jgi:pilus assembly protein CpaF